MDRSLQLINVIEKNPGIQFREIMRETGMKNGVLSYHARKLENDGVVKVERGSRQTRFYPPGFSNEDSILIKNLRQETPRRILLSLLDVDTLTFNKIVNEVKKSPSTVSIYLNQLIDDDIVEIKIIELKKVFKIKNKEDVQKIIDKYHPSLIEKSADHLADIFNSL
ncbi:MAG TPA: winged helix-turn-helix transcriptional regulator [Nitrosopumilaceae archaeon]|nr:winged helix-turn-helix transcriptional regulator [Nitrosopumilaceae archaeon]